MARLNYYSSAYNPVSGALGKIVINIWKSVASTEYPHQFSIV